MGKTKKSKDEITYHRPNPLINRNQSKMDARFGPEIFFCSFVLPQKDSNYSFDFFPILAVGFPEENIVQMALDADVCTWAESSERFIASLFNISLSSGNIRLARRVDIRIQLELAKLGCLGGDFG